MTAVSRSMSHASMFPHCARNEPLREDGYM